MPFLSTKLLQKMENSKLILVLRNFSPKQLQSFSDFVASPYFNKKNELVVFYTYLLRQAPYFSGEGVRRQKVYANVYGKETPYNEKQLGYLMSDLFALMEQFLVVEKNDKEDMPYYLHLLDFYLEKNLEKPFHHVLRTAQKYQENTPFRDFMYYYNQFQLYSREYMFFDYQRKHLFDENLQKALDNLDYYYLALKLRYSCEITNVQKMLTSQYDLKLFNEIWAYIQMYPQNDVPIVAIYTRIFYCMTDGDNETHFEELKQLLKDNIQLFPIEEARSMYIYAINYCIGKVNAGSSIYLGEMLQLYQILLDKRIIFDNQNNISPWTYINLVTIGVRNQDYEWTHNFINEYQKFLAPQFRQNAYSYNLAYLYFHQKDYDKTLSLLNEVVFDDVIYSIDSKLLLLRTYYELGEYNAFESLCISFSTYLKRNKLITNDKKNRYIQFIRFISQIHRQSPNKPLADIEKEVQKTKGLVNKAWLLEKITQLKTQKRR